MPSDPPFGVLLADPPWTWKAWSAKGEGKSASRHYPVLTLDAIKALPVASLAARDCVLFLWVTMPTLPQALEVIPAWGFTFKGRGFCWAKTTANGLWHFGNGYNTRKNPEDCMIATRGRPRRMSASVRELVVAPWRGHSRKPDEVRDRIRLLYPGPYLELFARERSPGWHCWGDEVSPTPCRLEPSFIVPPPADPGAGDRDPAGGAGTTLRGGGIPSGCEDDQGGEG